MEADQHPRQAERLAELISYDILDTAQEQEFDDIVSIAAQICGTEASTITFIAADRQWFKASVGMEGRPAPIGFAVCAHTVVADGFVEITDTLKDNRTKDNPGCLGEGGFRFYAGAQLISSNGLPMGTLCVLGRTAKSLTDVQRNTLQILANQVVKLLELRKSLKAADILRLEVDYRVKNSLQLVVSLTTLQKRNSPSHEVKTALGQMQERVVALVNLHNVIQNSNSSHSVNLRILLNDLTKLMKNSIASEISLVVNVGDIEVSARIASSVSVIVNEFVSNSVKHGFALGQKGTICLTGEMTEQGQFELRCADDGVGALVGGSGGSGIGMKAMRASAEQISGTLTVDTPPKGYQITFRCDVSKA